MPVLSDRWRAGSIFDPRLTNKSYSSSDKIDRFGKRSVSLKKVRDNLPEMIYHDHGVLCLSQVAEETKIMRASVFGNRREFVKKRAQYPC